jgi:8-oxo-dGTP diphosphatase
VKRVSSIEIVRVVAGILRNAADCVLIAQRPPGKHMAGHWEFPGGKLHHGESPEQALKRELREELGVDAAQFEHVMTIDHAYADRRVIMETYLVRRYQGEPHGREGQAIRWCPIGELADAAILPADLPIVAALLAAQTDATPS